MTKREKEISARRIALWRIIRYAKLELQELDMEERRKAPENYQLIKSNE